MDLSQTKRSVFVCMCVDVFLFFRFVNGLGFLTTVSTSFPLLRTFLWVERPEQV